LEIVIDSEVERLTNEINNLKEELMRLLDEEHDLLNNICPHLQAQYYEYFGVLETETAMYEEQVRVLQRKLELVRQSTNRGEAPDLAEINKQIKLEMDAPLMEMVAAEGEVYTQVFEDMIEDADPSFDNEELKKLYKKIAKALHPDLHPELTEQENRLFVEAITAYKNGDIDTIRLIEAVTRTTEADKNNDGEIDETEEQDAVSELQKQREYIVFGIDETRARIAEIKNSYPYKYKAVLDDPEQVKEIQDRLKQALADYKKLFDSYRDDLEKLMKEFGK